MSTFDVLCREVRPLLIVLYRAYTLYRKSPLKEDNLSTKDKAGPKSVLIKRFHCKLILPSLPQVPSILSEELQYNPFLQTEETHLKEALGLPPNTEAAQVLAELRRQKNTFDRNALGT